MGGTRSWRSTARRALASLLGALAVAGAARAEDGAVVFKRVCAACHTVEPGKNRIGPSLAGIVGRKAGQVEGFGYSEANKKSNVTWDAATLDPYLTDPKAFMPGTKMLFAGVKDAEQRKALIAYLEQAK